MAAATLERPKKKENEPGTGKGPPADGAKTSFADPRGVAHLMVSVDDEWKVKDLAALLSRLREAYVCLDFFLRSTDPTQLPPGMIEALVSHDLYFSLPKERSPSTLLRELLLEKVEAASDLSLAAIRIQSPGWADVVGSLNPFNLIKWFVETVRDWRTIVEKNRLENEKQRIENEKALAELDARRLDNVAKTIRLQKEKTHVGLELKKKAIESEQQEIENEKMRLENEGLRLSIQGKSFSAAYDLEKQALENRILEQKLIRDKLENLEKGNVSKDTRKMVTRSLVIEPLHELGRFVANGKLTKAEVSGGKASA